MPCGMIKKISHHYKQSSLVHKYADEITKASTIEEMREKVRLIKEANDSFVGDALPPAMVFLLEKYIGYVHPFLFPIGSHTSLLTRRVKLFFSSW